MLRTFNCGIGMVVIADSEKAQEVMRALGAAGEDPVELGTVVPDRISRAGHPLRPARPVTFRRKRTAILFPAAVPICGLWSSAREILPYPAEIALVLSNRPDAAGLTFAKDNKIACAVADHKIYAGREEFERTMQILLELHRVELICLAGFMRLLTPWFVGQWQGRLLNIHPALLPAYRGLEARMSALWRTA